MSSNAIKVIRKADGDWLDLTGKVPGAEGVSIRMHDVDQDTGRVVMSVRFEPDAKMPRHSHHCTALAYTLSGRWAYDDGSYSEGDLVLESVGNNHLPWSDIGTEMLLVFESPNGQYLDNQLEDGTCFHLGMPFFSTVAEMSASEWETAEVLGLVETIPEMRAA
ncbi:cupin domain-containing protein [Erythrobacter aureus]|uniref:cupin domain-containing protein n=1 Tax=Erythrobacter aureus TaxID=2182384 RepID=UPI003A91185F